MLFSQYRGEFNTWLNKSLGKKHDVTKRHLLAKCYKLLYLGCYNYS